MILTQMRAVMRKSKAGIEKFSRTLILQAVRRKGTRAILNQIYHAFPLSLKLKFSRRFARVFREKPVKIEEGFWLLRIRSSVVRIPLHSDSVWLDWGFALSVLGHDLEIKRTYLTFLEHAEKPPVFFDIGANYGGHSLLMQSQGATTVSFEPNPTCHPHLKRYLGSNRGNNQIVPYALGAEEGEITLCYPLRQTWLGTTDPTIIEKWKEGEFERSVVPVTTLDKFVESQGITPDLIKIDAEGAELEILKGGIRTLKRLPLTLILELTTVEKRKACYEFAESIAYEFYPLPLGKSRYRNQAEFLNEKLNNFAMVPRANPPSYLR